MASAAKHNIALWTEAKTSQVCGRSRKAVYHRCRQEPLLQLPRETSQVARLAGKTHQAYAVCLVFQNPVRLLYGRHGETLGPRKPDGKARPGILML